MTPGIRAKLFGGFGVVLVLLTLVGGIGWRNTNTFLADFKSLFDDRLVPALQLDKAKSGLYELRVDLVNYQANAAERQTYRGREATWTKQIDTQMAAYAATYLVEDEKVGLKEFQCAYPEYLKLRKQVMDLNDQGRDEEATRLRDGDTKAAFTRAFTAVDKLLAIQEQVSQQMYDDELKAADVSTKLLIALLVAALSIGAAIAFFLSRSVANGVQAVQRVLTSMTDNCATFLEAGLGAMANNDLTVEVTPVTKPIERFGSDEIGQTARVTNRMLGKLQSTIESYERARAGLQVLVQQVKDASDGVANSSEQLGQAATQTSAAVQQVTGAVQNVAAGAQDTSRGAQETNAAVAQLSRAIDGIANGASDQARQVQAASATATEMAAGVEQVSANASAVAAASQQTRAAEENGGRAVRETTAAMDEIQSVVTVAAGKVEELGKLGDRIGAVVETIDDIAEQTNLLALNAAIEAARAGEHGSGFAVVADEVRKLAERSSRETKAIAELISQVQVGTRDAVSAMQTGSAKVSQGSDKASQAGSALSEILAAVEQTVTQVTEIARAASQMSAAARSVTDAMQSISAVVEENTAATEEMAAQSGQVSEAIGGIAAVAEEQSAASEEVSASTEEMSAQVEEMTAQAQELAATADQLKQLVARFKLEGSVAATNVVPLRRAA